MAVLQSTNVQGALCVNGVAVGGGKDIKFCCFTASTTFTPSQDLVDGGGYIETSIAGGGGGGGGIWVNVTSRCVCAYGGGGGGGEVITNSKLLTSTDACTITIGAGGVAGVINCATDACEDCIVSTAGGNSSALGYTAYGGGGGGSVGCKEAETSKCYETNLAGGPSGGRAWAICNAPFNCQNINSRFLRFSRGVGGTSTFDEKNVSNVDLYNYNFSDTVDSQYQNSLTHIGCIHSIQVSGSLCGKEIYTSRTPVTGLGRPTTIIGGLNVGAGGKALCNTAYMDCDIEDGGVSSTYAGGGHGGGFHCGQVAQCDGFAGTNGIVVLRWEE
jgi:hypothetical protein